MGCDIHWCLEMKRGDKWVGLLVGSGSRAPAYKRWYGFFAELAGVRAYDEAEYPQPKGLPNDISDLARIDIEMTSWDHSHSYATVSEFVAAYDRAAQKYNATSLGRAELFGLDWWPWDDDGVEYRVVFAFDN